MNQTLLLTLNLYEIFFLIAAIIGVTHDYCRFSVSTRTTFLIFKFGIRRVIAYDIPIDIVVTGLLMYLFAGTYSGMLAA
jgi:hypothetical protein